MDVDQLSFKFFARFLFQFRLYDLVETITQLKRCISQSFTIKNISFLKFQDWILYLKKSDTRDVWVIWRWSVEANPTHYFTYESNYSSHEHDERIKRNGYSIMGIRNGILIRNDDVVLFPTFFLIILTKLYCFPFVCSFVAALRQRDTKSISKLYSFSLPTINIPTFFLLNFSSLFLFLLRILFIAFPSWNGSC